MKKVKKDLVFLKDEKSNLVEVPKEVIEGRFEIIDELREENKKLKGDNPEVKELKVKNLGLERDYDDLRDKNQELKNKFSFLDYADYIHYTVDADNISLGVSIRKQDQDIFQDEGREGTIYRLGLDHEDDREIFITDRIQDLESCINKVNDYIKSNFKTDLD